jgi:hypothetical protein
MALRGARLRSVAGRATLGRCEISGRDQKFVPTLAELEVLDLRPSGATPQDGRYLGCDEDDGFGYAGQSYLLDGDAASVVAFYRDAPRAGRMEP